VKAKLRGVPVLTHWNMKAVWSRVDKPRAVLGEGQWKFCVPATLSLWHWKVGGHRSLMARRF